jgi:amino acid adenylation domain-containing protein
MLDQLSEVIELSFEKYSDLPALVLEGEVITYAALRRLAFELVPAIRAGCGEGGAVGVLAQRTLPAYVAVLAAVLCRRPYVALNMKFPRERQLQMARMSRCSVLVADGDSEERRAELLADLAGELESFGGPSAYGPGAIDAPAYVMFTSGTTGAPKGVAVTRANLLAYLSAIREVAPLAAGARCTQLFDLSFDLSVHDLFHTWCSGGALYPMGPGDSDPVAFARRHRLTSWFSVPSAATMAKRFGSMAADALPDLTLSLFCGEPLSRRLAEDWLAAAPNSRLLNLYGPTEATIAIMAEDCSSPEDVRGFPAAAPLGRPFLGAEAVVVSGATRLAAWGETGELWLGGPQLAAGYLGNAELTAEKFVSAEFKGCAARRWYRTGDLVERSRRHGLVFKGRVDDQVKVRGYRVEVLEIEEVLRAAAGTLDVAVVPWPLAENGAADGVVAFVHNSTEAEDQILSRCAKWLPSYMTPSRIHYVDSIPTNSNGKVDRKRLRAEYLEQPAAPEVQGDPQCGIESIVSAWSALFPGEKITANTRLSSIVCDSLAYINVVLETERLLGRSLPDDWAPLTLAELTAVLGQSRKRPPYVATYTLREMIAADTHRDVGETGWRATLGAFMSHPTFRPVFTLRLCAYAKHDDWGRLILALLSGVHRHFCRRLGVELPYVADIGPGLLIAHGWGLVVDAQAVIGADVTLFHGATVGQADHIAPDGRRTTAYPTLGDGVWLGPHAMVIGCKVGAGSRVLGGAFVTKDLPARVMAGGNPAKILKKDVPPDVTFPTSSAPAPEADELSPPARRPWFSRSRPTRATVF